MLPPLTLIPGNAVFATFSDFPVDLLQLMQLKCRSGSHSVLVYYAARVEQSVFMISSREVGGNHLHTYLDVLIKSILI